MALRQENTAALSFLGDSQRVEQPPSLPPLAQFRRIKLGKHVRANLDPLTISRRYGKEDGGIRDFLGSLEHPDEYGGGFHRLSA